MLIRIAVRTTHFAYYICEFPRTISCEISRIFALYVQTFCGNDMHRKVEEFVDDGILEFLAGCRRSDHDNSASSVGIAVRERLVHPAGFHDFVRPSHPVVRCIYFIHAGQDTFDVVILFGNKNVNNPFADSNNAMYHD